MYNRPIKSGEWRTYSIEGEMNEGSDKLHFGGVCEGNGKFYFDDFVLMVENDKGILEKAVIENPGFETAATGNEIPHWTQGITTDQPVRVKGFSITSSPQSGSGNILCSLKEAAFKKTLLIILARARGSPLKWACWCRC